MILMSADTSHFTWDACGDTKEDAVRAMKRMWRQHCKQYLVAYEPQFWDDVAESATFLEITPGTVFRDGEPFHIAH